MWVYEVEVARTKRVSWHVTRLVFVFSYKLLLLPSLAARGRLAIVPTSTGLGVQR